jgi:hypothetical protein
MIKASEQRRIQSHDLQKNIAKWQPKKDRTTCWLHTVCTKYPGWMIWWIVTLN